MSHRPPFLDCSVRFKESGSARQRRKHIPTTYGGDASRAKREDAGTARIETLFSIVGS